MEDEFLDAAEIGNLKKVKELLKRGVDVEAVTEDGSTALIIASTNGHLDVVKALLEAGAEVNNETEHGETALLQASQYGYPEIVKALIEKGADVNLQDESGFTPLMRASQGDDSSIVKMLLDAGARVNEEIMKGEAALSFYLDSEENETILKLLLRAGAKVTPRILKKARKGDYLPDTNRLLMQFAGEKQNIRSRTTRRVLRGMNQLPEELTERISNYVSGPVQNIEDRIRPLPSALRGYTARERLEARNAVRRNEARERGRMAMENRPSQRSRSTRRVSR